MVDASLFSLDTFASDPTMDPDAVVRSGHWRIGILTDSLVRLEWSDDGVFVDDVSQMAVNRRFGGVPDYRVNERDGLTVIETDRLTIRYDGERFSPEGLSITVRDFPVQGNTWHYGDGQRGNLHGTARTLDEADGPVDMGVGLLSKTGWAVIDDSSTCLLVDADEVRGVRNPFGTWVASRPAGGIDLYFFGYGGRATDAVRDFHRLTGPVPLLPRFALGNWWSRYHRYDDEEYRALIERFEREGLPFSVAVLDMDWHLTDIDPKYGSGWTGYTWNRELFSDPEGFLGWLHEHGMHVTLNVHPRDGVRAFEDAYPDMARSQGIDPASGTAVDFDVVSPSFMAAYFDLLHHPLEDQGVDFWWLDWQQGSATRQKGLDPLWMLNHLHYLDSARRGGRPLTFSRYAGPGSHRYPIGFSGDSVVSWASLKFQPYFTAMASNIGYGWWSHDIGGHMFGRRDEALQARWYQFGAFSPICRLHSSDSPFNGKEPWNFRPEARRAMIDALRLRHAMIPYLYAMNRRAAVEGLPLIEPMYWWYRGGNVPTEYMFGTELIVSPIVDPQDPVTQRGRADVWLPNGEWFDFFDGRRYHAPEADGRLMQVWRTLERIPVFARAGGIVPLQELDGGRLNDVDNPALLRVVVFPGSDGAFDLWEDDGAPEARVRWARTGIRLRWGDGARVVVEAPEGAADVVPERRRWTVTLRGVAPADGVEVLVDGVAVPAESSYDAATLSLDVRTPPVGRGSRVEVAVRDARLADDPMVEDAFAVLNDAQMEYFTKERAYALVKSSGPAALASLHSLEAAPGEYGEPAWFQSHMPQSVIDALAEVLNRSR